MGSMEPWRPLVDLLAQVRGLWPNDEWTWDDRFVCVTGVVEGPDEPRVRAAVSALFTQILWTGNVEEEGQPSARALAASTGGLRGGQYLFCSQAGGAAAFCLWWPWGGGARASGRFGITGGDPAAVQAALRKAFAIGA